MIYLDNASTTITSEEVVNEMVKFYKYAYGNPSSKHRFGKEVLGQVELARKRISSVLNCNSKEILFNSGATEGINTLIRGFVEANIEKGQHVITTKVEHRAVLNTIRHLEDIGIDVTYLDVNKNGLINITELSEIIREDTILFATLWVNNETGVMQNIKEISNELKEKSIAFFVDATQAVKKIPIDLSKVDIDMLCFSAHKIHGPKGVGGIYLKDGIKINPLIYGGAQEKGIRSGTLNVPGIMGMAKAMELTDIENDDVKEISKYLEKKLKYEFDCMIVGGDSNRSPYITNVIITGIDADIVIGALKETMISTGSACSSRIVEPSHVLKNMGFDDDSCFSSLRISISRYTTKNDIDSFIAELQEVIEKLF